MQTQYLEQKKKQNEKTRQSRNKLVPNNFKVYIHLLFIFEEYVRLSRSYTWVSDFQSIAKVLNQLVYNLSHIMFWDKKNKTMNFDHLIPTYHVTMQSHTPIPLR